MNEKCYLVLSVRDLNHMLKVARKQAHRAGRSGRRVSSHCIVLEGIEVNEVSSTDDNLRSNAGELQICSTSISAAVRNLEKSL